MSLTYMENMEKKVDLMDIHNLLTNAEKGDANAQFSLGTCYSYGNGVEKDLRKAEYWWIKAASQCDGEFSYQYRLGYYYFYGFVLSKNYVQAVYWWEKSAINGNILALKGLATCYSNDYGVEIDMARAFDLYKKLATTGDKEYAYMVGMCYYEGKGVQLDLKVAVSWFFKSASHQRGITRGNKDAQYMLGYCYFNGIGVDKNFHDAIKWYKKAAKNGNPKAKNEIESLIYRLR